MKYYLAIVCPTIIPPSKGRFSNPLQTIYGSTVRIECNRGYFLTGENDLRCVDNDNDGIGEWNKVMPTCRGKITTLSEG